MIHTKTIDERAEQVLELMRGGWKASLGGGLNVSEVRLRKAGASSQVFAYMVMRYLERHKRVHRVTTPKGLTWTLRGEGAP